MKHRLHVGFLSDTPAVALMRAVLFALLAWVICSVANAQPYVASVQVVNLSQQIVSNRLCKISYAGPGVNLTNAAVLNDLGVWSTDSNGYLNLTNPPIGNFIVSVTAPPALTQFAFTLTNVLTQNTVITQIFFPYNGTWTNFSFVSSSVSVQNVSGPVSGLSGSIAGTALSLVQTNAPFSGGTATNIAPNLSATNLSGTITASSSTNFSGTLSGNVTGTQGATVVSSVGSAPLPAANLTGTIPQSVLPASVLTNGNVAQASFVGGITNSSNYFQSNSFTHAWVSIPANGHIHITDEHGSTYDFLTNGTLAISNLNGNFTTITNGSITASGTVAANGMLITNIAIANLFSSIDGFFTGGYQALMGTTTNDGSGLINLQGSNVVGGVANANYATNAGVNRTNQLWVDLSGRDSNTGLNQNSPMLTITNAYVSASNIVFTTGGFVKINVGAGTNYVPGNGGFTIGISNIILSGEGQNVTILCPLNPSGTMIQLQGNNITLQHFSLSPPPYTSGSGTYGFFILNGTTNLTLNDIGSTTNLQDVVYNEGSPQMTILSSALIENCNVSAFLQCFDLAFKQSGTNSSWSFINDILTVQANPVYAATLSPTNYDVSCVWSHNSPVSLQTCTLLATNTCGGNAFTIYMGGNTSGNPTATVQNNSYSTYQSATNSGGIWLWQNSGTQPVLNVVGAINPSNILGSVQYSYFGGGAETANGITNFDIPQFAGLGATPLNSLNLQGTASISTSGNAGSLSLGASVTNLTVIGPASNTTPALIVSNIIGNSSPTGMLQLDSGNRLSTAFTIYETFTQSQRAQDSALIISNIPNSLGIARIDNMGGYHVLDGGSIDGVNTISANSYVATNTPGFTGDGSGLTDTFSPANLTDIPIAATGVTNTATRYGVAFVTASSATFWLTNSFGLPIATNTSLTGTYDFPLGPGSVIHAASGLSGYVCFP